MYHQLRNFTERLVALCCVEYNFGVWTYDQVNAAAESNGRFFDKMNRFDQKKLVKDWAGNVLNAMFNRTQPN